MFEDTFALIYVNFWNIYFVSESHLAYIKSNYLIKVKVYSKKLFQEISKSPMLGAWEKEIQVT